VIHRPRLLVASAVAALAATALLGVALELATRPEPKAAPKTAPPPEPIQPKTVRTEAFTRPVLAAPLPPPPPPPPLLVEAPAPPKAEPKAVALVVPKAPDLCARHKLRKVYTRSGRSWRCRR
jgi:resuscitation-promoting factor RpfA